MLKNVMKKPLTTQTRRISLMKATAYCFRGRKMKYKPTGSVFLGRVGEAAEDKTFSDGLCRWHNHLRSAGTPGS